MITECVAWVGRFTATFQGEIDTWMSKAGDLDVSTLSCRDTDPYDDEQRIHLDSGGWLGGKTILLHGADEWYAAAVVDTLQGFADMQCDVRVGLLYNNGGKPSKRALAYIGDVRERWIPFDTELMQGWIIRWFERHGMGIHEDTAWDAAVHVGYDVESLVAAVVALAQEDRDSVGYHDLIDRLGTMGEGEMFDLTNSIVAGDRAGTAELLQRLLTVYDAFHVLAILSIRIRAYCAAACDPKADLEPLGVSSASAKYVRREAQFLSPLGAARAMQHVNDAHERLRGGIALPHAVTMSILTDSLARLFA